jgi:hypothetical protein
MLPLKRLYCPVVNVFFVPINLSLFVFFYNDPASHPLFPFQNDYHLNEAGTVTKIQKERVNAPTFVTEAGYQLSVLSVVKIWPLLRLSSASNKSVEYTVKWSKRACIQSILGL